MILGGAECLWEDVESLERMIGGPWPGIVIAANDAGYVWPRFLDHWVTMHPEKFQGIAQPDWDDGSPFIGWEARRAANGYEGGYTRWGRRAPRLVDRIVEDWDGGSSGFLCLTVAHELECPRAVLCGLPMTETPHFHDEGQGKDGVWHVADRYWRCWVRSSYRIEGWVRSMSGRTQETYGAPTLDWLGLNEEELN